MISKNIQEFCCEDISLIENYDKAIVDSERWDCHHRLEIQNNKIISKDELIQNNLYFNRPASELIFLTVSEHAKLHGYHRTQEIRKQISQKLKGHTVSEECKNKISLSKIGFRHNMESRKKIRKASLGKHWYTDGIKNVFQYECPVGFHQGMTIKSNKKSKGYKHYNNGIIETSCLECPEGFVPGRLPSVGINISKTKRKEEE